MTKEEQAARILEVLSSKVYKTTSDLSDQAGLPIEVVSRRLQGLRRAGKVENKGVGSTRWRRIAPPAVEEVPSALGVEVTVVALLREILEVDRQILKQLESTEQLSYEPYREHLLKSEPYDRDKLKWVCARPGCNFRTVSSGNATEEFLLKHMDWNQPGKNRRCFGEGEE